MNTKAVHFWNSLVDGDISNWEIYSLEFGKAKCCCGTNIKNIYKIRNKNTGEIKNIGEFCARRLGFKLCWTKKSDYLANAALAANDDKSKNFVKSLQDILPKWGESLKISIKQKAWLEGLTRKKWKWHCWEFKGYCRIPQCIETIFRYIYHKIV